MIQNLPLVEKLRNLLLLPDPSSTRVNPLPQKKKPVARNQM